MEKEGTCGRRAEDVVGVGVVFNRRVWKTFCGRIFSTERIHRLLITWISKAGFFVLKYKT